VLCHFPTRLFHETVKRDSFFEQVPLQRPGTDPQLDSNVLESRFLPGQEPVENSFHLLLQRPVGELLLQFHFQLRRYEFEQFRIVRYEQMTYVLLGGRTIYCALNLTGHPK
jgi:hypothetical protein